LKQAMDILKNPLRNNLPIPWEKIQEIDDSMGSFKQSLKRVEVPPPAAIANGGKPAKQSKRRKAVLLVKKADEQPEVCMTFHSLLLAYNKIYTKWRCIS
jgi:hypothetical protein